MSEYGGYGLSGYGDPGPNDAADPGLAFLVANSLTGRLIGRLYPNEWTLDDPLTGSGKGELTMPLPTDPDEVGRLVVLTRPHTLQVVVRDRRNRYWFGGPITAEPAVADRKVKVAFADWRAWFYAAALGADYIRNNAGVSTVDQMQAMSELAAVQLTGTGVPRMVVDNIEVSSVFREIVLRQATYVGAGLDDIARRDNGPDWWTYVAPDPTTPTMNVLAHVAVEHPERSTGSALVFRYLLGAGGNVFTYSWPAGNVPVSRVVATQGTPPDLTVVTAQDPGVAAGTTLLWDEVWQLPNGATPRSGFDYALGRLVAQSATGGTVDLDVDPAATDVGAWGPGDRARLQIRDGWRDVDLPSVRIIGRTLTGRGANLLGLKVSLSLDETVPDIETPTPVVI